MLPFRPSYLAIAATAAITLVFAGPTFATSAQARDVGLSVKADTGVTDFSSRRRQQRVYRNNGGAAAAAAFAGIVGTAIAAGAARDYYYDRPAYGYGYGPGYNRGYYGGGPGYYGGGGYGYGW